MAWMTDRDASAWRADVARLLPGTAIVQEKSEVINARGDTIETWSAKGTVACRIDPVGQASTSRIEYDLARELLIEEYQLTVPWNTDIDREDRVQINSDIFEIVRIEDDHSHRVSRRALLHFVGIVEA